MFTEDEGGSTCKVVTSQKDWDGLLPPNGFVLYQNALSHCCAHTQMWKCGKSEVALWIAHESDIDE